ncbi:MAG: S1C family serine protease [Mobilitalea sp.]
MAEFDDNNRNHDNNRDNNEVNNQNQNNKVPEYSFWAEQTPTTYNSNYNPRTNSGEYGNNGTVNNVNLDNQIKVKKPPKKVFKFMLKALCFGLLAGISFIGVQNLYYAINPDAAKNGIYWNSKDNSELSADKDYKISYTVPGAVEVKIRSAISDVTDATIPAIVSINSTVTQTTDWFGQQYDEELEGSGSGIIVGEDEKELLIATNNHVVAGTNKITVTFTDGTKADAEIKGTDATADLAVVTVDISKLTKETLDAIEIAKLGNSDEVKVGEMAIAIGNAMGYGQSVTVGYISAKDREVEVSDGYDSKTMILLQTDAAINPGNSGGALLNVEGEVIGINTVKYASNEVEGMGYAIPISRATPIINELMSREIIADKEKGFLGIAGNDVTEDVASFYNMPIGVFVNEVSKSGAAEKAGLLSGDIIIAANDIEITSITQLREYVNSFRAGTEVEITFMRNTDGEYEETKVSVTLGSNPNLISTTE